MRLSEALEQVELKLVWREDGRWHAVSSGPYADAIAEVIEPWSHELARWWATSPTAIRECDVCGEVSLSGSASKKKCYRTCDGTMVPLKPTFTKKRPRGKKIKTNQEE